MNEQEIIEWLKTHNIKNYFIYDDLSVDVEGEVNIADMGLETIPIQFHVVNGSFDCSGNNLASLKGCPKYIDGSFYCNNNKLVNLEGGPETVTGHYDCSDNLLITLKGLAKSIGTDLTCKSNKLTVLEYLPNEIKGDLHIHKNQLVSLKGCPEVVEKNFDCSYNNLISLEYAPKIIGNYFFCDYNNINSIEGFSSQFSKFCHSGNVINEFSEYYKTNTKGDPSINVNYNIIVPILNFHKLNAKVPNKTHEIKGKNKI